MFKLNSFKLSAVLVAVFIFFYCATWIIVNVSMNLSPCMSLKTVASIVCEIFLKAMAAAALIFWVTKKATSFATVLNIALVTFIVHSVIDDIIVIAYMLYNHF
jgi:hypothetical protein